MALEKTIQIEKSANIAVPIEKLWDITANEFHNVDAWISGVNNSEGSGNGLHAERSCLPSYKGFSKTTEKIIAFNPELHQFTYKIVKGLPGFVKSAQNEWIHQSTSEGTKITMVVTMKVGGLMGLIMGGIMKKKMASILEDALEELKTYAETGQVHPRKKVASDKYAMSLN